MKFRTEISLQEIQKPTELITYQSKISLFGSCFVEHIGHKLDFHKFSVMTNSYGVLFHPLSIEKALQDLLNQKIYTEKDLLFDQGLWHSPHHHSDFSHPNQSIVLEKINQNAVESLSFLQKTTHFIVTLGTAWVYHHIETDQLVANCHKIPQQNFVKRLLRLDEIVKSLENIIALLQQINPEMQLLFTVSPVRHVKDGMQQNARSKALLLSAIYHVVNPQHVFYFPSYEMIMDDLRDYRFFTADLVHPNDVAIEYVWELFKSVWIHPNAFDLMREIARIQSDIQHRPFHPQSENHQKFLKNLELRKEKLSAEYGITF